MLELSTNELRRGGTSLSAATLAGGAFYRAQADVKGQGRHPIIPTYFGLAVCAAMFFGGAVRAETPSTERFFLPSGQDVSLVETLHQDDPATVRLRFLAPALSSPMTRPSFEELTEDLEHLCATKGVAEVNETEAPDAIVIISLSAEFVEFGTISPDVPQVFEAFRVEDGRCMLEVF